MKNQMLRKKKILHQTNLKMHINMMWFKTTLKEEKKKSKMQLEQKEKRQIKKIKQQRKVKDNNKTYKELGNKNPSFLLTSKAKHGKI